MVTRFSRAAAIMACLGLASPAALGAPARSVVIVATCLGGRMPMPLGKDRDDDCPKACHSACLRQRLDVDEDEPER